jgi:pSer/pThr/pTyr-binding forkhead associated (FHA) protein
MTPVNDVKASRAFLAALTAEGREALHGAEMEIAVFPFRVGRESRRFESRDKQAFFADKRKPANRPNNDLYLVEDSELLSVSREHFQIVRGENGFALEDRGSTVGTIVEGRRVGGENTGGLIDLHDGDVIIVGGSVSPHVYKFRVR